MPAAHAGTIEVERIVMNTTAKLYFFDFSALIHCLTREHVGNHECDCGEKDSQEYIYDSYEGTP